MGVRAQDCPANYTPATARHAPDRIGIIRGFKNTGAGDDYLRSGADHPRDVVGFDPAICFHEDRQLSYMD